LISKSSNVNFLLAWVLAFSFEELTNPSGGSQIYWLLHINLPLATQLPLNLQLDGREGSLSQHHPPSHSVLSAQLGFVWHVCIGITIHLQMIG
jgi:hypothetical protein